MTNLLSKFKSLSRTDQTAISFAAVLYIAALIIKLTISFTETLIYIGILTGFVSLIFLIYDMSKNYDTCLPNIKHPLLEMIIGLIIVQSLLHILPTIPIKAWDIGLILRSNIIFVLAIWIFTTIRQSQFFPFDNSWHSLKRSIIISIIIFALPAIPLAFYTETAGAIITGKLKIEWLPNLFSAGFLYYLFLASFPEEIFYRGFLQTRLSIGLNSKLAGLIYVSIFFGLQHIVGNSRDGYGILNGFAVCILIQTTIGILFGVLYMRTGSLLPGILVHAAMDSAGGMLKMAEKLGLMQ